MAIDWTTIYKPERVRPPHLDDLIGIYQGETEDDYEAVDLTAEKGTLNTAIAGLFTTFKNLWPFTDEADFDNQSDALSAAIQALITGTTHIDDTYSVSKETILGVIKTELNAAIASTLNGGTNYPCTRCSDAGVSVGRYPASNDPGETSSTPKQCESCDGLTRTGEPNTPSATIWSATNESYISL